MGVKALTAATNNPLKHKAVQIQTPYMPPLPPMDPKEVSPYFLNQAYKKFNRTSKSLSRNLPPHLLPNPVATLPLLPPFKDDMVAQPLANVTTQPQAFYDLTRAFSEETLISFRSSLAKLTDAKKKAAQKAGLSRGSIEYGHRAVAFEATLNARLQQSIEDAFHNVIQDLEEKLGKEEAKRRIEEGNKEGHWIMLENIHLMPTWLLELEKILDGYQAEAGAGNQNFKLFLSADPSPNIPIGILDRSIKLTNEPPQGLKANMKRAWTYFPREDIDDKDPKVKSILFALCFFHSTMIERRRFGPKGWNMMYPFSIGDLRDSYLVLNKYMESN